MNQHALRLITDAFNEAKASGMTQEKLASLSGVKRSTIANYVTAVGGNVHVEAFIRIARALGRDPQQWLTEIEAEDLKRRSERPLTTLEDVSEDVHLQAGSTGTEPS